MEPIKILTKDIDVEGMHTLEVYEKHGGYQSLKKLKDKKPDEIIEMVKASGRDSLRG